LAEREKHARQQTKNMANNRSLAPKHENKRKWQQENT